MYFAKLQGMKHIWFTEHDIFWNKKPYSFGFEPDEAAPDENGVPTRAFLSTCDSVGEVRIDTSKPFCGNASMCLNANVNSSENWRGASASTVGGDICQSLCRMPTLSFAYRGVMHTDGDVRYIFDICLSERPPDQHFAHIIFVAGSSEGLDAPHTLVVPISVSEEWQNTSLDIAALASSEEANLASIGGLDNIVSCFTVRMEKSRLFRVARIPSFPRCQKIEKIIKKSSIVNNLQANRRKG